MAVAALSPILNPLSTFLREESTLLGGLRHEVQHIKDEFGQMKGFLRRAEALAETSILLEEWVSQVRDVAYDAEDVVDEFILKFGRHYDDTILGRVQKAWSSTKKLIARHQLATEIQAIKDRIQCISAVHQRYRIEHVIYEPGSSLTVVQRQNPNMGYNTRGDALFLKEEDLVGIERRKTEIRNLLTSEDSQLRVTSVVGMGGLGKTTLVKKVYDDPYVKKLFKHHLWITVSQSFKIETLLNQAIRQLHKEINRPAPDELDTMDADSMKQVVLKFLHQKDYILVLDDIWRWTDWDGIRMAFPRNNCRSHIIITTRNTDLALAVTSDIRGEIYPLEPLNKKESRTLFCKKVFEDTSCPTHLEQISENIIDRCGGLPLAIVVIAGVLARKSRRAEEWDLFNRSLGVELERNNQLDKITKILSLSYTNLPDRLRICFLYLSIIPEDAFIKKKRLIRLWSAEGFVQKTDGITIEEEAEVHLNELINLSLVQVAQTTNDGRLKACRVHDLLHQIILQKARKLDIAAISSGRGLEFSKMVRRLIIHSSIDNLQVSNDLFKCLRSLVLFESIDLPFLSKLLRGLRLPKVLDFEGAPIETIPSEIFKLFHLKYLNLRNTKVKNVPKGIGNLQKLETLDLKDTNVIELPVAILKLQRLQHLTVSYVYVGFKAPDKIGNLQSLQSLCYVKADQIVTEIGKLTQLRTLGITSLGRGDGRELCSSLGKLPNLRSLRVSFKEEEVIDLQYPVSSTPRFLRTLKLWGRLETAPHWILSLRELTRIHLVWSRLREDPLHLIQDLPNLKELVLAKAFEGKELCFRAGGFSSLKTLSMGELQELRRVIVEEGAMPCLQRLWMAGCKSMEYLQGTEHLIKLQSLEFSDMSDGFIQVVRGIEKKRASNKKIAHSPEVIISKGKEKVI